MRNLWVIATALVLFSAVIALAERFGRQTRDIDAVDLARRHRRRASPRRWRWCPGCPDRGRPSAPGLFLGHERELAARFGFLLAIPAVFASGLFSLPDAFHPVLEGMSATGPQLLVATVIAFVVG